MKTLVLLATIFVMVGTSCQTSTEDNMSVDGNKKNSTLYHERNLDDVDKLLADDFVGSFYNRNKSKTTLWYKEGHRNAISNYPNVSDSIIIQVAEDDWVFNI